MIVPRLRAHPFLWTALVAVATGCAHAAILRVVPTYENSSVYVEATEHAPTDLRIRYRQKGTTTWTTAHPLSASAGMPTPRGSLFGLRADTDYEVRCESLDGRELARAEFRTWSETPPVARTIRLRDLSPDGGPVLLDQSGTPEGWVRYVGEPGFVIDGGVLDEEAVLLDKVRYVILDGATIRGGRRHGIQVRDSRDIRIRNCDIAGFGRVGAQDPAREGMYFLPGDPKPINWDAGIYVDLSGDVTIEHNFIHGPRNHANSWFYGHPAGPNAVFVRSTGGMVIRYNDFVGGENNRWNDVIEGYGNSNADGGFNRDGDIHGNFLAYANDDGIELDGGQMNVRFYGNKIEGGLCGISTAPNHRGPSYVFDNLVVNLGDERGAASAAVKNGGGPTHSKGVTYFYHNTFLTFGHGVTAVGFGSDRNRGMFLGHTRNNIFAVSGAGINDPEPHPGNTYDRDLFSGLDGGPGQYDVPGPVQTNGLFAPAGFDAPALGRLSLRPDSPARGRGERIEGLDTFFPASTAPDLGVWSGGLGPARRVAASLDHGQLVLASHGGAAVTETVILSGSADLPAEGASFRVLGNAGADWLSAAPDSGILRRGQSLPITLTLSPTGSAKPGLLLGAAIIKFDGGGSLPLTVYGVIAQTPFRLRLEAESLKGAEAFERVVDSGASAGKAVRLVDAAAGKSGQGAKALQAVFHAPAAGAYFVAFRVRCAKPYGNHDSMFVSVNGSPPRLCAITGTERWGWSRLTGKTMHIDLPAGENRLTLIPREEVDLDVVLIGERPLFAGESVEAYLAPPALLR